MKLPDIGPGAAFGVGTNFRVAQFDSGGEMSREPLIVPTPATPAEFFALTGRSILDAAHGGAKWALLGIPGPVEVKVDAQDNVTQRLNVTNISALNHDEGFDPIAEMIDADPEFENLVSAGFKI